MKNKILAIFICMLVAICSAFTIAASTSVEKSIIVGQINCSKQGGNTLITDIYWNRIIEVDSDGFVVWQKTGLEWPFDAERLANGNTLIAELGANRVIEVDSGDNIVWEYSTLNGPSDAERLSNGNTLISDMYNNRVIEVDSDGFIAWQKTGLNNPVDAERLANGNTLITEVGNNRVIEVDSSGTIVWEKAGLQDPLDAERLVNGNTLIADSDNYRLIEVDGQGSIVWQYFSTAMLIDAERLTNGNTLLTEAFYYNRVIEIDSGGTIVWEKAGFEYPVDVERLSYPPDAPKIGGQTSGKTGTEYEYTFNATDPDNDDVKYYINWGDNTTDETDFNSSGTEVIVKHIWSEDGTYNITAIAEDIHGIQGPEGKLEVTMPKNKPSNFKFNLLNWLFKRFPNAFPILRQLIVL